MNLRRSAHMAPVVCLVAATALAAAAALRNGFSYDDTRVVARNEFVTNWAHARDLLTPAYFDRSGELSYRPVTTLSYFVDHALWGGGPWGYHVTNVALHAAAVLGFYWLLIEAGFSLSLAFASALLFGLFASNAESICSIGFREEVMMSAFGLPALAAGLRVVRTGRIAWLAIAVVGCIVAVSAKETGVVAPVLLLLLVAQGRFGAPRRRVAGAALALTACVALYCLVRFVWLVSPQEAGLRAEWSSDLSGPLAAARTVGRYVVLLVWPPGARVAYGPHDLAGSAPLAALAAAVGAAGVSLIRRRGLTGLSTGLLWCLAVLAPASNLVPTGTIFANRIAYLASAGIALAAASLARGRGKVWVPLVAIAFTVLLGQRSLEWRDDPTLWRAAVRRNPRSLLARVNAAISYDLMGRDRYAAKLYERFLRLEPRHGKVRFNLAAIFHEWGQTDRAVLEYERSIACEPERIDARCNLARLHREQGRLRLAIAVLRDGLALQPRAAALHRALGLAHRDAGEQADALAAFTRSIQLEPGHVPGHYHQARALMAVGRDAEAERVLVRVLQWWPEFGPAKQALAELHQDRAASQRRSE